MWIVRLALKLPYTFAVMAILIVLLGILAISRMPTDIFPVFDIPVVTVIWSYNGITPGDMEKRYVTQTERAMTTTVSDIEHIESQSVSGLGIIKIYFEPGADIPSAIAQVTASTQTILRALPPGTTPPFILRYDASDVPVLQATVSSPDQSEQSLFDYAQNFIRTQLATVQGAQLPLPYGGRSREINVDLNIQELTAHGLTPADVNNAISANNLILPTGDAKIGGRDYTIQTNSSPTILDDLNRIPIKDINGAIITVGDVAQVRDGYAVQTNIVNQDGRRAVLLQVYKSGGASTLDVVNRVRAAMPRIESTIPQDVKVNLLADQSIFVRASVNGVVREAIIAACLTALMILLFLGSLRSTMIVAVSIPLSILTSIIILGAIGETLNIMTLGGLALAVGILVDDTTVTIENINRNLGLGLPLRRAIIEGAREIALPALVSTMAICIVFAPVAFLSGAARSLFVPLALAVVFAMAASYLLSRTVTPTFAAYLLRDEVELHREDELSIEDNPNSPDYARVHAEHEKEMQARKESDGAHQGAAVQNGNGSHDAADEQPHAHQLYERHTLHVRQFEMDAEEMHKKTEKIKKGIVWRIHSRFNGYFARMRGRYVENLRWVLEHRTGAFLVFVVFCVISFCLFPFVGRDFFPTVDAGQFELHVRMPPGTRLEDTAAQFASIEAEIRNVVPKSETGSVLDNIGEPISINLAYGGSDNVGPSDGVILVSLKPGHHPTADYQRALRKDLPAKFPGDTFFFEPGDIVSQILNFGLPAPIDVQISGPQTNVKQDYAIAQQIQQKMKGIPGAVDVHMQQIVDVPQLTVNVDRVQAAQLGLTQANAADNLLISLASTGQASPSFFMNVKNGVVYSVATQTPQYRIDTIDDILNTPIGYSSTGTPELLNNVAHVQRGTTAGLISHYNIQPVYDIYANNQDRDLGGVADDINKLLAPIKKNLPRGSTIAIRGQVQNMNTSFSGLGFGLIGAVLLVYLLLAVNFQSWTDPLVVVSGAPGALSGILWMLFATGTSLSVPSLMGAIMSIGVSTANSVLLVTFANERRLEGMSAIDAVVAAGYTRLRPILMTALAMIIGMIPMALGLGEGGEQNAPLGRAVIGGLLIATFTTLFVVPITYSWLRKHEADPVDDSDLYLDEENQRQERSNRANGNGNGNGSAPSGGAGRQPAAVG